MRKVLSALIVVLLTSSFCLNAQDLLNTRIRMISGRKKAVYFEQGVFHNDGNKREVTSLSKIRQSFVKSRGYERIVFDFNQKAPPAIYGSISGKEKKIYLDFFNTEVSKNIVSLGSSKYISDVNFYPIDKNTLSVELVFKTTIVADIFYLSNPGRLVIDVKK